MLSRKTKPTDEVVAGKIQLLQSVVPLLYDSQGFDPNLVLQWPFPPDYCAKSRWHTAILIPGHLRSLEHAVLGSDNKTYC